MQILDFTQIKRIYTIGDIHGEFKSFFHLIKNGLKPRERKSIKMSDGYNDSLIIVCGDCGLGFNKIQYYIDLFQKINELLAAANTTILFVRGNHDDPSYFTEDKLHLSNIKTVSDYSVILTADHKILCVGGGISCDRTWRKKEEERLNRYKTNKHKKLYWPNEAPYLDLNAINEITDNDINIDIVISHSSPTFAFPQYKANNTNWFKVDKDLANDVLNERQTLYNVYEFLINKKHNLKGWFYGHFHETMRDIHNGVVFQLLGNNMHMLNVDDVLKFMNQKKKKKNPPFIFGELQQINIMDIGLNR